MTDLALFTGGTLTAAAADAPEPRVAEGILVPYGQPGRTNLGPKTIRRGALRLVAEAPVIGLYGHDRDKSVSRLIAHEDRDGGLWGRLRIAETPAGDLLLSELRAGVRDGLSVELSDLAFDPADPDTVTSARLDAVAHVPLPAYDSARVHALAATLNTQGDPSVTAPTTPAPAVEPAAPAAIDYTQLAAALAPHLTAAAAPAGLPTGALQAAPSPGLAPSAGAKTDDEDPVARMATLQAAVFQGNTNPELRAALADITNTGLDLFQSPAGALGEKLWEGAGYTRQFTGLFRQRPLTSWKGTGWQWVNRPQMAAYAGDKTEIPTNTVSVEPKEWEATRVAGGWDIDRKFRDFADTEFWTEFYAAQAESYREITDAQAAAFIAANALDITIDANAPAGYADVNVAQADILRAAALGTAILEDTPRVRQGPDYIGMNTKDWLSLVEITNLDLPAFLALLKIRPEQFMRSSQFAAGEVTLGVRNAATFRELGGGSPIRVEALDVARAGVDSAVYGYTAFSLDRPGGIITVPLTVPAV